MNKKKKKRPAAARSDQAQLFTPEGPRSPPSPPVAPASPAPIPFPPPRDPEKVDSPEFLETIRVKATQWAQECGLRPPFTVGGPERVNYPKQGHGYVVTLRENEGKERLGSARFSSSGAPTYWSVDGIATG
jgi:hypothetical protein